MKILIATPIRSTKNYSLDRWLANVAQLQQVYPADLLLVDNSFGRQYMEKLKDDCKKFGIKNYQVMHIELPPDQERHERMARSREVIRQEFLAKDYAALCFWETDVIIPVDALDKLVQLLQTEDFWMVDHNCWMRGFPEAYCTDFGICLIARKALEQYNFLLKVGSDPASPDTYEPLEAWFKLQILRDGGSCIEVQGVIGPVLHLDIEVSRKMRVLIGTPIHQSKDYSMSRWLENVSRHEHTADLLLVDNSPGVGYMEKVAMYCAKHGVDNYEIKHLELPEQIGKYERIARSREVIRQYFLDHDYDAWFTWECDQIVPTNALDQLIRIMESGNYQMVNPNKWARDNPDNPNTDFGCCLIKREALEKYGFLNPPGSWETGEAWFKTRVLQGGGNYIDVYGIIEPIYHLDQ